MPAPSSLRAPVVLMGLTLAGCPGTFEPEYGVADVGPTTLPPTTSATDGETDAQTDSGSDSGGSDSGSSSDSSSTGMADSGTATGASTGEPDYGVPETTTG